MTGFGDPDTLQVSLMVCPVCVVQSHNSNSNVGGSNKNTMKRYNFDCLINKADLNLSSKNKVKHVAEEITYC